MRIAIITISKKSHNLANQIEKQLKHDPTIIKVDVFKKDVKETVIKIFHKYDGIIGIMATGIMVRSICRILENKTKDPTVLVVDDEGKHVLSLLSGHLGGGNQLAIKISDIIGAEAVITTATDVQGKIGIDTLARKYYLDIDDPKYTKIINSAVLEGHKVILSLPSRFEFIYEDPLVKESYKKRTHQYKRLEARVGDSNLILTPKKIVVGIGSRKGISTEKVINAIEFAMNTLYLPIHRLDIISTGEMKKDEEGIIKAAHKLNIPLKMISKDNIKRFKDSQTSNSKFVEDIFGVRGVCEPTALITAGENSKLIFKKTSLEGVTVAVAVSNNN